MFNTVDLTKNTRHVLVTAYSVYLRNAEHAKANPKWDYNGMEAYCGTHAKYIPTVKELLDKATNNRSAIRFNEKEIYATREALQALDGIENTLGNWSDGYSWSLLLGMTRQQLMDVMDIIHGMYEMTPQYQAIFQNSTF